MITNGKTNGKDKNEIRQLPQLPNDGVVGGAGPMGWVAGSGAKLFKGALGLVKNVLGRSSKTKINPLQYQNRSVSMETGLDWGRRKAVDEAKKAGLKTGTNWNPFSGREFGKTVVK